MMGIVEDLRLLLWPEVSGLTGAEAKTVKDAADMLEFFFERMILYHDTRSGDMRHAYRYRIGNQLLEAKGRTPEAAARAAVKKIKEETK